MDVNWLYKATLDSSKSIVVHEGGSSSSKTYSIIQGLFTIASTQRNKVITVVGSDLPNLKKGAIRDAKNVVDSTSFFSQQIDRFNKSDYIYYFKTGSIIEFTSYADEQDAKNGKRDYCFLNEANGISKNIFEQLRIRTNVKSIIDFNPSASFWAHETLKGRDDVDWFNSTYRDNDFIHPTILKSILGYEPTPQNIARKTANEYRWKVYGLGELGRLEGLIFPEFEEVDEFPKYPKWKVYGLDFGYTNDPTVLTETALFGGELYTRQLIYETGLTNSDIAKKLRELNLNGSQKIIADSAEPKSIEELNRFGFYLEGAEKGKDSVMNGIDQLKRYKINVLRSSKELVEEFSSYTWAKDRNGQALNKPIDKWNHGIDSIRYATNTQLFRPDITTSGLESLTDQIYEQGVMI